MKKTLRALLAITLAMSTVPTAQAAAAAEPPVAADPAVRFVDDLPAYQPTQKVSGTIRLWGHGSSKHDFMGGLIGAWIEAFGRYQPDVKFEYRMYGTASAIGALYTGAGDLAILGEEISPDAARAFQRARGYPPTGLSIATGSVDADFFDYAHMIFVNKDNPIQGLSLTQLDAIFGAEPRHGHRNIRTWGGLGLKSGWAGQPIRPYGWKVDEDFALFFRERVLGGSHRWNPAIQEYVHGARPDGSQYDRGQRIVDGVAADRDAIGVSNVRYATPQVRALPLAWTDGGPYYAPTPANLISQRYPLTRVIPAYIDKAPGAPVDPAVREFLRFVLSREGQQAIVRESSYLPLGAAKRQEQLEMLQ